MKIIKDAGINPGQAKRVAGKVRFPWTRTVDGKGALDMDSREVRQCLIGRRVFLVAACSLSLSATSAAQPAWKPERTVEIVVGSAAGGGNDTTARNLLRIWQGNKWLENATVVNKVGGGGSLAYAYIHQAPGDGHRIAIARTGLLTNHIRGLSPINYTDMTPIAMVADDPMALTVRADSPIRSVGDLVARWRSDPQSLTTSLGSSSGSTTHFLVALVARSAGVNPARLKVINPGGAATSVTQLLGGHIDMVSLAAGNTVAHHKAGTLRMIGVAADKRLPALPEVPTIREQGIDVVQGGWTLIVGASGLTAAQTAYWEGLLERTVNHPEWKKALEADNSVWLFMKSQPTREFLRKEYETDRGLLVELGMVK
jgi:putative tricarboxylic transport membrane protein